MELQSYSEEYHNQPEKKPDSSITIMINDVRSSLGFGTTSEDGARVKPVGIKGAQERFVKEEWNEVRHSIACESQIDRSAHLALELNKGKLEVQPLGRCLHTQINPFTFEYFLHSRNQEDVLSQRYAGIVCETQLFWLTFAAVVGLLVSTVPMPNEGTEYAYGYGWLNMFMGNSSSHNFAWQVTTR